MLTVITLLHKAALYSKTIVRLTQLCYPRDKSLHFFHAPILFYSLYFSLSTLLFFSSPLCFIWVQHFYGGCKRQVECYWKQMEKAREDGISTCWCIFTATLPINEKKSIWTYGFQGNKICSVGELWYRCLTKHQWVPARHHVENF